jgi:tRNA-specific 2-thiouridylase
VIGHHDGFPFYTIGQRKGLGVSNPEPLFVLDVLPTTNTVIVGTEHELYHDSLTANNVNLLKYADLSDPREFVVKVRYKDEGAPAVCWVDDEGILQVQFTEPRKALSRGQSVAVSLPHRLIAAVDHTDEPAVTLIKYVPLAKAGTSSSI